MNKKIYNNNNNNDIRISTTRSMLLRLFENN